MLATAQKESTKKSSQNQASDKTVQAATAPVPAKSLFSPKDTGITSAQGVIQRQSITAIAGTYLQAHPPTPVRAYANAGEPELLKVSVPKPAPPFRVASHDERADSASHHVAPIAASIGTDVSTQLRTPKQWRNGRADAANLLNEFNVIYDVPWLGFSAEQEFNPGAKGYIRHAVITSETMETHEYQTDDAANYAAQQTLRNEYDSLAGNRRQLADAVLVFRLGNDAARQALLASLNLPEPLTPAQHTELRSALRQVRDQTALIAAVTGLPDGFGNAALRQRLNLRYNANTVLDDLQNYRRIAQATWTDLVQAVQAVRGTPLAETAGPAPQTYATRAQMTTRDVVGDTVRFSDRHGDLDGQTAGNALIKNRSDHAADALSMTIAEAARFAFLRAHPLIDMTTATWLLFNGRAVTLGTLLSNYHNIVIHVFASRMPAEVAPAVGWETYNLTAQNVSAWLAANAGNASTKADNDAAVTAAHNIRIV